MPDNESTIREIFAAVFDLPGDIDPASVNMKSLENWDSMRQMSLITALENEFDIFVDASDASKLTSFLDVISFINNHSDIS